MVDASNFKLKLAFYKIGSCQPGPFKGLKFINDVAYEIELPLKSKVHLFFHVSCLNKFIGKIPPQVDVGGSPSMIEGLG